MRISPRRSWIGRAARLAPVAVLLSACTVVNPTGGIPRQPLDDIPVPASFTPFSSEWTMIRAGRVTAARLVYMAPEPVEPAVQELTRLLTGSGWTAGGAEAIERAGFKGRAVAFSKGRDTCRAEVLPTTNLTRIDLVVGRIAE